MKWPLVAAVLIRRLDILRPDLKTIALRLLLSRTLRAGSADAASGIPIPDRDCARRSGATHVGTEGWPRDRTLGSSVRTKPTLRRTWFSRVPCHGSVPAPPSDCPTVLLPISSRRATVEIVRSDEAESRHREGRARSLFWIVVGLWSHHIPWIRMILLLRDSQARENFLRMNLECSSNTYERAYVLRHPLARAQSGSCMRDRRRLDARVLPATTS